MHTQKRHATRQQADRGGFSWTAAILVVATLLLAFGFWQKGAAPRAKGAGGPTSIYQPLGDGFRQREDAYRRLQQFDPTLAPQASPRP